MSSNVKCCCLLYGSLKCFPIALCVLYHTKQKQLFIEIESPNNQNLLSLGKTLLMVIIENNSELTWNYWIENKQYHLLLPGVVSDVQIHCIYLLWVFPVLAYDSFNMTELLGTKGCVKGKIICYNIIKQLIVWVWELINFHLFVYSLIVS